MLRLLERNVKIDFFIVDINYFLQYGCRIDGEQILFLLDKEDFKRQIGKYRKEKFVQLYLNDILKLVFMVFVDLVKVKSNVL